MNRKRGSTLQFHRTLYGLLLAGLVLLLCLVFFQVDSRWAINYAIGYIAALLLSLLYFAVAILLKAVKLPWPDLRRRLLAFLTVYGVFVVIKFVSDTFIHSRSLNIGELLLRPTGFAVGAAFFDLLFLRKKRSASDDRR